MINFKKKLFVIIIFLYSNLYGQASLSSFNLKDSIYSIIQHTNMLNHVNNNQSWIDSTHYFFNKNGYLIKEINNGLGSDCSYIRGYNKQGNLIEEICRFCGSQSKKIFIYNENEFLLKKFDYSGAPSITEFKYNKKNQLISEEYKDSLYLVGPSYRWIVKEYKYDTYNNLKSSFKKRAETVTSKFSSWTMETYEYNSKNKLISIFTKDSSSFNIVRWQKLSIKYDDFGQIINKKTTFSDSSNTEVNYIYQNKKIIHKSNSYNTYNSSTNSWENKVFETKYNYDSLGNCILEKSNAVEQRFNYEYDNSKNWIKKTMYIDETALSVTYRKIEYYD